MIRYDHRVVTLAGTDLRLSGPTEVKRASVWPLLSSSRIVTYSRPMKRPSYGRSRISIRESHLTLATPYQPGAISRTGPPCSAGRYPVHAPAENVARVHRLGQRHAARELLGEVTPATSCGPVSVPQNTTSRPSGRTPASCSTAASDVPVQTALPTRPQAKGSPWLPEHSSVKGISWCSRAMRSSSEKVIGCWTSPLISIRQEVGSISGWK